MALREAKAYMSRRPGRGMELEKLLEELLDEFIHIAQNTSKGEMLDIIIPFQEEFFVPDLDNCNVPVNAARAAELVL